MIFYLAIFYLGLVLVLSCASFVMYGWDKRQASGGGRRIPEKNLHTVALLGGWPGAIIGQKLFRHKTQKTSFRLVFFATVFLHVAVSCLLIYWLLF